MGKYLANSGADNIGLLWITLEKTSINVLASRFIIPVVFIELSSLNNGLLSRVAILIMLLLKSRFLIPK